MSSALCPQSTRVVDTLLSILTCTVTFPSAPPTATWMFSPHDLRLQGVVANSRPAAWSRSVIRPPSTIKASSERRKASATVTFRWNWPSREITWSIIQQSSWHRAPDQPNEPTRGMSIALLVGPPWSGDGVSPTSEGIRLSTTSGHHCLTGTNEVTARPSRRFRSVWRQTRPISRLNIALGAKRVKCAVDVLGAK